AVTVTPSRHPPPVTRGTPTPSPRVAPALVIVMAMVPAVLTVNERLLCPPGATTLDQLSLMVVEVVLGAVGVLLLHPAASRTPRTARRRPNPESRIPNPGAFMDARSECRR